MNWQSWTVLLVVAMAVAAALYWRLRPPHRKGPGKGCSGNCSCCG